jgi:repressor LexA
MTIDPSADTSASGHITRRQREILDLIRRHIRDTGYPPTRAEIARHFGFRSINAAVDHLKALARHGVIELQQGASRGIRLLEPELDIQTLPVIGRVAAGSPILAIEHIEERCQIDPTLFKPRADYLLRVRGASMCDAGILDGDLLAVHRTTDVLNGQIVVARLGEEVTVKRLRRHARWPYRIQLLPENPSFEPIQIDLREEELTIEGLGVGVLRIGFGQARRLL